MKVINRKKIISLSAILDSRWRLFLFALALQILFVPNLIAGEELSIGFRSFLYDVVGSIDPDLTDDDKVSNFISTIKSHRHFFSNSIAISSKNIWDEAQLGKNYDDVANEVDLGFFQALINGKDTLADFFCPPPINHVRDFSFKFLINLPWDNLAFENWIHNPIEPAITIKMEIIRLINNLNLAIANFKIHGTTWEQDLFDAKTGFDFSFMPQKIQDKFISSIKLYFENLPLRRKRKMALAFLKLPISATLAKIVATVSIHSGVIMTKMIQLNREFTPPEMQQELKGVLDDLPPTVSSIQLRQMMIEEEDGLLLNSKEWQRIFSIDLCPIAVASIGQVHLIEIIDENDSNHIIPGVLKVIKSGVAKEAQEDLEILEQAVKGFEFGEDNLRKIKEILAEELDLSIEAQFAQRGKQLYTNEKKQVFVASIMPNFKTSSQIIIQERAPGRGINKYSENHLAELGISQKDFLIIKGIALRNLFEVWYETALTTGFVHADLHAGNIFLDIKQNKPFSPAITMIDFGSIGELTPEEIEVLVKLGNGVFISYLPDVMSSLKELVIMAREGQPQTQAHTLDHEKFEILSQTIEEILYSTRSHTNDKMVEIFNEFLRIQLPVPAGFFQLFRGLSFLDKQISKNIYLLNEIDPAEAKKLMTTNDIFNLVSFNLISRDLASSHLKLGFGNSILPLSTLYSAILGKIFCIGHGVIKERGLIKGTFRETLPLFNNFTDIFRSLRKNSSFPWVFFRKDS